MGDKTEKRSSMVSLAGTVKLLALAVFLGYIIVWLIVPTDQYRNKWQATIRAATNSTYFTTQGTNIILFTSSIFFIAILGCIYAHLKKTSRDERAHPGASFWRRPAIVGGPLGTVSWTELFFLTMFIGLVVYYFSMLLSGSFARITAQSLAKKGQKMWQAKLESGALRLGFAGNLVLAFLFIPVTRGSSILPLVGLTSEGSIKYHIWMGHIAMLLFTLHGLFYVIVWGSADKLIKLLEWDPRDVSNLAGVIALLSGFVLWATTLKPLRRKMFEVFFYGHHFYVLFMLFFLLHVGIGFVFYVLPGIYLFMVDRFLRFLQSRNRVRLVSARLLPGDTVELNFAKSPSLKYTPLSMVFINVPSVSMLQWHPFTVASNSNLEPDILSVIIKKEGSWTRNLHHTLSATPPESLRVALEGPYGPVSNTFTSYDALTMISGGSGIVPFVSIIRDFISRSSPSPKLHLICSFKSSADLTMLDLLLPLTSTTSDLSHLNLHVDAYVTREKTPPEKQEPIRTLQFKPRSTDEPVSAVLGRHSWLTLAAVIAVSFGAYLLLFGIVNVHYTNNLTTVRALLSLLVICGVIASTSTIAYLLSKERCASDGRQVHSTERELESVPQEGLALSTEVHYGARPDLKKILMEHKESMGVMVSGPTEMRRHVAAICSSGLCDNLHYESTSFSW